jgi:hypothetical protein
MRVCCIIAACLFFATPTWAQQEGVDMRLRAAGFQVRLATTPSMVDVFGRL